MLALARCERQEAEDARTAIAYDADREFTQLSYDVTWLSVACIYAHVCARLGEPNAARTLYGMFKPWRDQVAVSVVAWGCVAHYLGMLATTLEDFSAASDYLEHAAHVHKEMAAPVWSARTRLETARMLAARRRPGDDTRSRSVAEQALGSARDLGCDTIARDAGALLDGLLTRL